MTLNSMKSESALHNSVSDLNLASVCLFLKSCFLSPICMTQKPTHNTTISTPPTPHSYLDNLIQTVNNLNILFHKCATKTGY